MTRRNWFATLFAVPLAMLGLKQTAVVAAPVVEVDSLARYMSWRRAGVNAAHLYDAHGPEYWEVVMKHPDSPSAQAKEYEIKYGTGTQLAYSPFKKEISWVG